MLMLAALLSLLAAGLFWYAGRQPGAPVQAAPRKVARPALHPVLSALSLRSRLVLAALVLAGGAVGYRVGGAVPAALGAGGIAALALMILLWRRSTMKRQLRAQLPGFLNQITRRVTVGANLSQAVQQAVQHTDKPLQRVLLRARQRAQLGDELADAFHHEARRTGLAELDLIATVFNINHQYGGSIAGALDNLVRLLQQRERAQRELKAMTGETRFTALVLGAVPALMALYLLLVSPDYLLRMWHDDGGRQLLLAGAFMQLAGVLVLWRMVRSI
ncbi:type II secretion system F family protein [Marinobacterium aestuariivivens]|uniref:Type II secretion system F family protein n=1 Tax=Marinobacterium aestuariivivens TaxID=1698799 RepID=A0ABW2A173_9GAMM